MNLSNRWVGNMHNRILLRAQAKKTWILLRRYLFNTVVGILGIYMLFMTIFLGGQFAAPTVVESSLEGLIVGIFLWVLAIDAYSAVANEMARETKWGTLEQLYMSPYGFQRVILFNSLINLMKTFFIAISVLVLMLVSTDQMLSIDLVTVIPLTVLLIAPVIGMGLVFGGLVVLYKRVRSLNAFIQLGFVAAIASPADVFPGVRFLPVVLASDLLNEAMAEGVRLWEFAPTDLATAVLVAIVYFAIGYGSLLYLQRSARDQGVLGDY